MKNKNSFTMTVLCVLNVVTAHSLQGSQNTGRSSAVSEEPELDDAAKAEAERVRELSGLLCIAITAGNNYALPAETLRLLAIASIKAQAESPIVEHLTDSQYETILAILTKSTGDEISEFFGVGKKAHREYRTLVETHRTLAEKQSRSAAEELDLLNQQFPLSQDQTLAKE